MYKKIFYDSKFFQRASSVASDLRTNLRLNNQIEIFFFNQDIDMSSSYFKSGVSKLLLKNWHPIVTKLMGSSLGQHT